MAATDLAPTIGTIGQQPAQVSGDAGAVTAQKIGDLITGDRYLAAKTARSQKKRGLLFSKLLPAGAMPDSQATGIGGIHFSSPGGIL